MSDSHVLPKVVSPCRGFKIRSNRGKGDKRGGRVSGWKGQPSAKRLARSKGENTEVIRHAELPTEEPKKK